MTNKIHYWGKACKNEECEFHNTKSNKALRYTRTSNCVACRKRWNDKINPIRLEKGYLDKQIQKRKELKKEKDS